MIHQRKVYGNTIRNFINDYGYKTAGLEVFRRMLQKLTNEQINYGMKHFLSKMDIDKISKGEHPEFRTVDKIGMFIRGHLTKSWRKIWIYS